MRVGLLGRYMLVSVTLAVAAMASALAAELPVVPEPGPDIWWTHPPPPPRFSWSGCHLGVHFGGAFVDDTIRGQFANPILIPPLTVVVQPAAGPPTFFTQSQVIPPVPLNGGSLGVSESGVLSGAQAGCDLQLTRNWVIGIGADASGTTASGSNAQQAWSGSFVGSPVPATTTVSSAGYFSAKTDVISTVTGRLGYSFERGEGLIYAKAGAAFVNNRYGFNGAVTGTSCNTWVIVQSTGLGSCTGTNPPFTSPFNFGASETRGGWTVGTGVEWAILTSWSVKLEYDYLDFGRHNTQFTGSTPAGLNMTVNQHISEVKLGVNYLFGWR
jgi:outer membrane immunogenic protein